VLGRRSRGQKAVNSQNAQFSYPVVLEPLDEGGFQVYVPALPEIVTWGEDEAHALAMAKEAIELVVEDRLANGEPLPQLQFHQVTISVAA
jgi:antitoxin HicB